MELSAKEIETSFCALKQTIGSHQRADLNQFEAGPSRHFLANNRKIQIILTEIYRQSTLGESISLTIPVLALDADVGSSKKESGLNCGW